MCWIDTLTCSVWKTSTCFRGNNNEILLECVLISLNKITVLKVWHFSLRFGLWPRDPGYSGECKQKQPLKSQNYNFCSTDLWLEMLNFLHRRCGVTVSGQRRNKLQNGERKAGGSPEDAIWGLWGRTESGMCVHTQGMCAQTTPPVPPLWPLALNLFLLWGGIASNIVFQFNKMWFPLLCG